MQEQKEPRAAVTRTARDHALVADVTRAVDRTFDKLERDLLAILRTQPSRPARAPRRCRRARP